MHTSAIRSVALVTGVVAIVFVTSASAWVSPSKSRSLEGLSGSRTSVHTSPAGTQVQTSSQDRSAYVEGEVLIKYRPTVGVATRQDLMARLRLQELHTIGGLRVMHAKLPPGQSVEQAMQAFAQDPAIEYVQPNYIYKAMAAPNDPLYGQQWGFRNTAQQVTGGSWTTNNPGIASADMNVESAWDHITDCRAVVVAVVDSGVNYLHQDLAANMWDGGASYPNHGFDFVNSDNDPLPADADGHGTHVAATIAASGNNGIAGSGVCWQARIMAVRVLSASGGTTASVVAGVNFSVTQGARVINMSLGGPVFDQAFSDSITTARDAGVVVVVAAGNDSANNDTTAAYPCNYTHDNLVCVAALDQAFDLAGFSNYGSTTVDVGAPGTNVLSAWAGIHIEEDFSTWTRGGAWTTVDCDPLGLGETTPMLVNPANWCSSGTYANNASDVAYRTYDFTGATAWRTEFFVRAYLETGLDYIDIARKTTGGDPFGPGGTALYSYSNSNALLIYTYTDTTSSCANPNCSFGFRLRTNATNVLRGPGVFWMTTDSLVPGTSATLVINGTSMATPHTAGVAALLMSFNPSYTYADTVAAIKNGGRSVPALANITVTGRAVDAFGSLSYIQAPTGLAAVVQ